MSRRGRQRAMEAFMVLCCSVGFSIERDKEMGCKVPDGGEGVGEPLEVVVIAGQQKCSRNLCQFGTGLRSK